MCGICGVVDTREKGISLSKLKIMNDIAFYRGPDEGGIALFAEDGSIELINGNSKAKVENRIFLGFGHRRLSIIDLSELGHQPMFDESKRYCIVYNGEIYNYIELRRELESLGYKFISNSDTEVIIASYIVWGVDCQSRFNGMWAFAIYDRVERTLFCSRDRFGIKPFYYTYKDGVFAFSSEIKQIIEYFNGDFDIDKGILAEFLFWGFESHSNRTFFKNIFCLPQSHYLLLNVCNIKGDSINPIRYWEYEPVEALPLYKAVENFKELFFNSVELRLRSDVPVGLTLSGGLDSSSVACVMAKILQKTHNGTATKTFTCDYELPGFSERKFTESVVKRTKFNQFYIHPKPDNLTDDWYKFVWHMEEPFSSLSYFSNWMVMKRIREENIKVILNGQGGDELLLGYSRYRSAYLRILLREFKLREIVKEVFANINNANMPLHKQLLYQLYFSSNSIRKLRRLRLIKPYLKFDFFNAYKNNTDALFDSSQFKDLNELQIKEFYQYQLQHLLRHEDRVSMASSIEVRLPFLDFRLFNFILGQDYQTKISSGWSKSILRQAMDGVIPDEIRDRSDKMGFETPILALFTGGKKLVLEILDNNRSDEIINLEKVSKDFQRGRINHFFLCSVLTYLSWRKVFKI